MILNRVNDSTQTRLRKKWDPYYGLGLACLFMFFVIAISAWQEESFTLFLQYVWLPVIPFVVWVYLGEKYQIFYSNDEVIMKASGMKPVSISIKDITSVESEVSVEPRRPFRRITLYSSKGLNTANRIDLSLKHFEIEDIKCLLHLIERRRPALQINIDHFFRK